MKRLFVDRVVDTRSGGCGRRVGECRDSAEGGSGGGGGIAATGYDVKVVIRGRGRRSRRWSERWTRQGDEALGFIVGKDESVRVSVGHYEDCWGTRSDEKV